MVRRETYHFMVRGFRNFINNISAPDYLNLKVLVSKHTQEALDQCATNKSCISLFLLLVAVLYLGGKVHVKSHRSLGIPRIFAVSRSLKHELAKQCDYAQPH